MITQPKQPIAPVAGAGMQNIGTQRPTVGPGQTSGYNAGRSALTQAAGAAMPSQQSLDRAAARTRSRLAGREQQVGMQLRDQYAGRNLRNSGAQRMAQRQLAGETTNQMAQQLTDLELGYMDKQMEGAKTLADIGTRFGDLDSGMNADQLGFQKAADDFAVGMGGNVVNQNRNAVSEYEQRIKQNLGIEELRQGAEKNQLQEQEQLQKLLLGIADWYGNSGNIDFLGGRGGQMESILSELFGLGGATFSPGGPTPGATPNGGTGGSGRPSTGLPPGYEPQG